jgi:magnesium chelatase family protein
MKEQIIQARIEQHARFKNSAILYNADMNSNLIRKHCQITKEAAHFLKKSFDLLGLSARAYDRILKVSRTIADMDRKSEIDVQHIAEAIQYRCLDRKMGDDTA